MRQPPRIARRDADATATKAEEQVLNVREARSSIMSWNGGDGAAGPSAMGWGSPPPSEKPYAPTVKVHMVRHPDGTAKEYELSPAQHALLCFFVEKRSVPAHEIVGFVAKIRSPDLLARA